MNAKIYKIINDVNNKEYVGQTYLSIEKRFERHCNEAKWKNTKRMPIVLAIKKYGKEHFKVILLEKLDDKLLQEDVDKKEVEWGLKLNTISPNGYNLKLGGSGHGLWSNEIKKKIGKGNMGKKYSPETIKRMSISHLGHKMTDESKKKLSDFWKGIRPSKLAQKNSLLATQKTYFLINPNGEEVKITNMAKFCRENNLGKVSMCRLVTGKQLTYKGWKLKL